MVDDSSEEEWTYTNARSDEVVKQKTNVKVRLDFGEGQQENKNEAASMPSKQTTSNKRQIARSKRTLSSCAEISHKKIDEELKKDKYDIQRLVVEVEKLVREEETVETTRNLTPLVFEDRKDGASSNRAKYARIREWLKLNYIKKYDEMSNSEVSLNK